MSEQELRDLDDWIAEHVMGWERVELLKVIAGTFAVRGSRVLRHLDRNQIRDWKPTTNPSDAFAVLEKCLNRCKYGFQIIGSKAAGNFSVRQIYWIGTIMGTTEIADGETLELAICNFAKQLFSK